MRSVLFAVLLLASCQPRKMEVYNPPPVSPAPAPEPTPTTTATAAPPPTIPGAEVLGPAFTPKGLVFPPGWQMPPMPSALPFPMPTAFPFPTGTVAAPTATTPPTTPPPASDPSWPAANTALEDAIIARVNQIRAVGAVCGTKAMPPVPPVAAHDMFRAAARGHAKDMATRNYFDHNSPEGKGPADRIRAAGWLNPGYSGENIAAGNPTAEGTINQWLKSQGHCENMLDKDFKMIGVGYFENAGAKYQHYWVQAFGG